VIKIRIGISGTHNSGKTTLMKAIVEKYPAPVISGIADAYTRTSRTCLETQVDIFKALVKAEKSNPNFVHDRTVFDSFAYFHRRYKESEKNHITAVIYGKYMQGFVEYLQTKPYDLVVFIDDILPIEDNGTRDLDGQEEIFDILSDSVPLYSGMFDVPVISVRSSTETRMKKINSRIKKIYQQKRVTDFDKTDHA